MAKAFLDTCVVIDYFKDDDTGRAINHFTNDGGELVTSITVMGELVQVCMTERKSDLFHILRTLKELDVKVIFPVRDLRFCCICLDNYHDSNNIWGSSITDRTHLAYAITYGSDFFVTSRAETKALRRPEGCSLAENLEVVDIRGLRDSMGY